MALEEKPRWHQPVLRLPTRVRRWTDSQRTQPSRRQHYKVGVEHKTRQRIRCNVTWMPGCCRLRSLDHVQPMSPCASSLAPGTADFDLLHSDKELLSSTQAGRGHEQTNACTDSRLIISSLRGAKVLPPEACDIRVVTPQSLPLASERSPRSRPESTIAEYRPSSPLSFVDMSPVMSVMSGLNNPRSDHTAAAMDVPHNLDSESVSVCRSGKPSSDRCDSTARAPFKSFSNVMSAIGSGLEVGLQIAFDLSGLVLTSGAEATHRVVRKENSNDDSVPRLKQRSASSPVLGEIMISMPVKCWPRSKSFSCLDEQQFTPSLLTHRGLHVQNRSARRQVFKLEEALKICSRRLIQLESEQLAGSVIRTDLLSLISDLEALMVEAFECGCSRLPGAMDVFEEASHALERAALRLTSFEHGDVNAADALANSHISICNVGALRDSSECEHTVISL
eukprot:TRINITY_DN22649_c0_g7_i1.p1 TRINITY_DN22649_c0_g7~~TRINITY_DN22649_c0_g7_i1.p1  ORF type:complete len:450 (+),score=20.05 TRINITY_DN22649_c0_g7_i1:68-1417(+)